MRPPEDGLLPQKLVRDLEELEAEKKRLKSELKSRANGASRGIAKGSWRPQSDPPDRTD